MSVKKGVVEWRDIADFPEWEVNSKGDVRNKMSLAVPEKKTVSDTYWVVLTVRGRDSLRGIRGIMRNTFPEVNFK